MGKWKTYMRKKLSGEYTLHHYEIVNLISRRRYLRGKSDKMLDYYWKRVLKTDFEQAAGMSVWDSSVKLLRFLRKELKRMRYESSVFDKATVGVVQGSDKMKVYLDIRRNLQLAR